MTVVLECMNVGLSFGRLFTRAVTLILMSCLYIGRIDIPFFDEGVGAYQIEIDPFPTMFRRLLLLQEANRHPYLEVVGRIYLMKLRYSTNNEFITKAGSCWRLLFVRALMPWIAKYRILAKPALNGMSKDDISDPSDSELDCLGGTSNVLKADMSCEELKMHYEDKVDRLQARYKEKIERLQMMLSSQRMFHCEETTLDKDNDRSEDKEMEVSNDMKIAMIDDGNKSVDCGGNVPFGGELESNGIYSLNGAEDLTKPLLNL